MHSRAQHTLTALHTFLATPLAERLAGAHSAAAEQGVLALFHDTVAEVPAYRALLAAQGVAAERITSLAGFQSLPLMTKANYLRAYPLAERCRHGALHECDMLAVSSGSTGTPTVWPRTMVHELDIAFRFEQVFQAFRTHERNTLAVVCFALGTWVGGMFTAACCRYLALKGYPITVVTPGNKKEEIFRVVEELGPSYQQIVLLGYPPFIKDVIDSGRAQQLDWPRYRPKLVFAGEVFSEEWRTLVCERIGAEDPSHTTATLYGTADGGVLGNETPLSIALRRFFAARPGLAREVFGESRLPTLVQYDPRSRYFELHDDATLVVSGDSGVPLLRYHIADKGGIISHDEMRTLARTTGCGAFDDLTGNDAPPLPFVYLFGRADFTVSYFGANIYPENISVGLEQPEVRDWVSGKFVLQVVETADRNEAFALVVELLPDITGDQAKRGVIAAAVLGQLRRLNSEFANYVPMEYQQPQVTLKSAGDPEWFPAGVKHRYTRKNR